MRLGAARHAAGLDVSGRRKPASVSAFHRRQSPRSCADQIVDGVQDTKPAARLMSAAPASRLARCSPCAWHAGSPYAALQPLFPSRYDGAMGAACCPTVSDPAVLIPPSRTSSSLNEQEVRGGSCGGAQSPWQARLTQGVTTRISSALTCVHCCLVLACLSLLWTRRRALPFGPESCRCKPSCLSEARASRWSPAGSLAPGGRTVGRVRRASLLLLVPWLAVCTAAGTLCSNEPTVCDGTFSGTYLCALPTTLSPPLHSARG